MRKAKRDPQSVLREWHSRQRNTVFPDTVRNERNVNFFFWHGAPRPTVVQRIAALLYGVALFMLGMSFIPLALRQGATGIGLLVPIIGFAYLGGRIFWNGCKSAKRRPALMK